MEDGRPGRRPLQSSGQVVMMTWTRMAHGGGEKWSATYRFCMYFEVEPIEFANDFYVVVSEKDG